ncbi:hypothetical protein [Bradyrhizobium sp. Ghvi]|uniref:hypothetical protein n=1 Tax=Bradyrhizobium sp. Ghvi TaxID=1855319 RepID=UPI001FCDD04A|nr:hypothetical protein [Bradyrhizobium sp. Ghvi]
MSDQASDGWATSASAWIAEQGEHGDYVRRFVLDTPMRARVEGCGRWRERCGRAVRC